MQTQYTIKHACHGNSGVYYLTCLIRTFQMSSTENRMWGNESTRPGSQGLECDWVQQCFFSRLQDCHMWNVIIFYRLLWDLDDLCENDFAQWNAIVLFIQ